MSAESQATGLTISSMSMEAFHAMLRRTMQEVVETITIKGVIQSENEASVESIKTPEGDLEEMNTLDQPADKTVEHGEQQAQGLNVQTHPLLLTSQLPAEFRNQTFTQQTRLEENDDTLDPQTIDLQHDDYVASSNPSNANVVSQQLPSTSESHYSLISLLRSSLPRVDSATAYTMVVQSSPVNRLEPRNRNRVVNTTLLYTGSSKTMSLQPLLLSPCMTQQRNQLTTTNPTVCFFIQKKWRLPPDKQDLYKFFLYYCSTYYSLLLPTPLFLDIP